MRALIALLLLSGRAVIAQTPFELSPASSSTTTTGPTTAVQSATLLESITGTTFVAATPTTTVPLSLSNGTYPAIYPAGHLFSECNGSAESG